MTDREQVLKEALAAGINVLKENFGDDYDRALVLSNIPLLLEVMWPYFESYHDHYTTKTFEEQFHTHFPDHKLENYGGTVLDYIIGNVRCAVANEIIAIMETWDATLQEAHDTPSFAKTTYARDWDVASAHTKELISEVKQYRSRGPHSTQTGTIHTVAQETPDVQHFSTPDPRSNRD